MIGSAGNKIFANFVSNKPFSKSSLCDSSKNKFSPKEIAINSQEKSLVLSKVRESASYMENKYHEKAKDIKIIENEKLLNERGKFKYCVMENKNTEERKLYVAENTNAAHPGIAMQGKKEGFEGVVSAGHVSLAGKEGQTSEVLAITNTSGHFQPEGTYPQQVIAEKAFTDIGLDGQGKYQVKVWSEKHRKYLGKQFET